jgi:hypothetical protein
VQRDIAAEQAKVLGEAVRSARIDIVGGDINFFDRLVNSITRGKEIDRMVENSQVLTDLKETFFDGGDPEATKARIRQFVSQFGLTSEDVKNLTISATLGKMLAMSDESNRGVLNQAIDAVKALGLGDQPASSLGLAPKRPGRGSK